jgi:hypothetical protein
MVSTVLSITRWAKSSACQRSAVLTLVAAQLALAGDAMQWITALEGGGDCCTHREVVGVRSANSACLDAMCVTCAQTGSCESE